MSPELLGRDLDATTVVVVLAVLQSLVVAGLVLVVAWWGPPWRWRSSLVAAVSGACGAMSLVWLWIDRPLEGAVLVDLAPGHAVTAGDLLALPTMVAGLTVLVLAVLGRRM